MELSKSKSKSETKHRRMNMAVTNVIYSELKIINIIGKHALKTGFYKDITVYLYLDLSRGQLTAS